MSATIEASSSSSTTTASSQDKANPLSEFVGKVVYFAKEVAVESDQTSPTATATPTLVTANLHTICSLETVTVNKKFKGDKLPDLRFPVDITTR